MLGLFGLMKENLEQQGVVLPRFFRGKDKLYHGNLLHSNSVVESHSVENEGSSAIAYYLFLPKEQTFPFDFSKESWSFELKAVRNSYYSGSNFSYVEILLDSGYRFDVSVNKSNISAWWGHGTHENLNVFAKKDFTAISPFWLQLAYDKNSKIISASYSLDGHIWNLVKQLDSSLFDLTQVKFRFGHCAKDATIYRKDIKFTYGDEVLFG